MNINNLRIAIFNFLVSKQLNEDLLIRIDGTSTQNDMEEKDKETLASLSLFSIDYKNMVYQNENLKYHQKMAMQLMSQKKAFACFCSDEKLQELKEEAKKAGKPYSYDGFCSTLSDETVLNCNAPFTVRIQRPEDNIEFTDLIKGDFKYNSSQVNDTIILKHDKSPTYNFACAVDDMLYNISTVIREEEHLSDTAKQVHIRQSLGYDKVIQYIHLPKVTNASIFVKDLIDEGFLPSAIANYLVLLGNNTPKEIFTLEEALEWFDIKKVSAVEVSFDLNKLRMLNGKHLEIMDELRLSKILGFADADIGKLGKLFLEEACTIKEIQSKLDLIFAQKDLCEGFEEETKMIMMCLKKAPFMNDFDALTQYIVQETNLKAESLFKPLQYVLTGRKSGPSLTDIYPLIKNYLGEIVK
jgi:glutamyl-tRNA synthetase